MEIRVGFIGIEELHPIISKLEKEFNNIAIHYYFYKNEMDSVEICKRAEKENEVLLFGGPVPYQMVKKQHTINVPCWYISYDGASLYRGLLEATQKTGKTNNCLSFDTIAETSIAKTYEYLGIKKEFFISNPDDTNSKNLVKFHLKKNQMEQTDCAVTCLRSAFQELKELEVPVVLVLAPESSIREGLQKLILMYQSLQFRKAQIVVGRLEIVPTEGVEEYFTNQHKDLEINQKLVTYAQKMHAAIFKIDQFNYVFYTTLGILEKQSNSLFYECILKIQNVMKCMTFVGLGVGETALIANRRTSIALQYAKDQGEDSCYLTIDDQRVINLLTEDNNKEKYRSGLENIRIIAEKYQLSMIVLERIYDSIKKLEKTTITAEELAGEIGQTTRNVRRTLNELVAKNLARVVGEEQIVHRGRPKIVYEITFINSDEFALID
jgi:hypothetical protein